MENGLPQNTIQALAQTADGFLWIGTEIGLVRFDGAQFTTFDRNSTPAIPGSDVRCLLAANDGALWVGTSEGLARLKDSASTIYTGRSGLPGNSILSLRQRQGGTIIVSTDNGEIGIDGTRLIPLKVDNSLAPGMLFDQDLPGGVHAVVTRSGIVVTVNRHDQRLSIGKDLPGSRIQVAFADREGTLWVGTNAGLVRWSPAETVGKLEQLPVTDPLAHASILALMEDSEGDLWAGTESDGLHILRGQRFRTFGAREGLSSDSVSTVVEDRAGALWAGTDGGGLDQLKRTAAGIEPVRTWSFRDGLPSDVILSLAAAPNGDLWVGTPDGLSRIRAGHIDTFTSADSLPDDFVRSLLADADGSLWIGTRHGLTHWPAGEPSRAETFTHANGLGSDLVGAMARDSRGGLWVATLAGLSRVTDGKIANYTTANGLSSNVITALLPLANGSLLIGTQDRGWNLWDGRQFSPASDQSQSQASVRGILDDGVGHLWFAIGAGLARCDWKEPATGSPLACVHWMEFGAADGLRSRETATNSHPSASRAHDDTLWFATPKGLVEVDPAHFPVNDVVPPIAIERFVVDDRSQPSYQGSLVKIGAGHVHFEFQFAALSFVAPQKVRYRFRLEGFDRDWTDAGARRNAYYTNIPPGTYTFRVQAANNDGLWNTAGSSLKFELQPHFYQTLWFYTLAVLTSAALILFLLRRRLRLAEREFQAVLGERNRIAREIHDTLAQGYVGISVQLEVITELLRQKKLAAAEQHLDTTRGYVREGLAEARQSIWALRSQDSAETTLPVRLRRLVEASGENGYQARFNLHGAYHPLPAQTEREMLRITQEAIHNVNRHAAAKNLAVYLEYGHDEVTLELRDDGRGFTSGSGPVSPAGHYGLTGMRERAAAISAAIELTSEPGQGTTVRLSVPAPRHTPETRENH